MAIIWGKETTKQRPGELGIVDQWVQDAIGSRGTWDQDIIKWFKLRTRVKKEKSYPFPNCSNMRMPTLDIKMKKMKSQIRNGVLGIRPVVQVIPTPGGDWETAAKIEKLLDHLIMDKIKYELKFLITVDQSLEIGFYLNEPYWKLEIQERQHEFKLDDVPVQIAQLLFSVDVKRSMVIDYLVDKFSIDKHKYVWKDNYDELIKVADKILAGTFTVKFKSGDVVCNMPEVALVHPDKCYVVNDGGFHPQTQPSIVTEKWYTREELEYMAEHGDWDISLIIEIIDTSEIDSGLQSVKDAKEGITSFNKNGKVKVYSAQGYIDGKKKLVVTAPEFNSVLKSQSLILPSGMYNIIKFFHELRDDRWYHHRGYPEILEDLVKEIDVQHMQKIDRQTIVNSPMFLYRAGMIDKNTTQFGFGQGIPVNGMQPISDVFQSLNNYNQAADFSYDREQQILKAEIDEYTGQVDFTLSQQLNRREPRTAQEVEAQSAAATMVTSLDLSIYRNSFEELANMVWELWCEYGDDEYEFNYFGNTLKETIKLNKEELQGKYVAKVRANDDNTNSRNRLAKAQSILQAVANPLALQLGVTTADNVASAYKRYFQELNVDNAEELYTKPQPKEPGVPDKTMPKFEDLEGIEQDQVITKLGLKPDTKTRIYNKQREVQNERSDNLVNVVNSMK